MSTAKSNTAAFPKVKPGEAQTPSMHHLLNIPNFLTLCRLISIPFFLALITKHRYTDALYLFAAAAVTDSLDGTIARWSGSKTELGAFLDPFADKLLLVSSFVVMTIVGIFPGWFLAVVAIRDVIIVFGYFMLVFFTGERIPVRPSYLGKATTFFQLASVVAALFGLAENPAMQSYWYGLLFAAIAATGSSGLQYIYRGLVWLNYREPSMFE